ncbi:MAG: hypothetical protein HYR84_04060 [Planctomycetes bacterium]|nr:hypothetical protein [Planctomycetota bacterium]
MTTALKRVSIQERFRQLVDQWRAEIMWTSSIQKMCMHPAYQQIIGLGPDAIPLLLAQMQHDPDHWSWALHAITGENPVREEHRGDIDLMAQDWVEWGKANGYLR